MKREHSNQEDPKFDRKTKALRKAARRQDEQREANEEITRLMRNPNGWRTLSY
jgi:hypothetical protein